MPIATAPAYSALTSSVKTTVAWAHNAPAVTEPL